MKGLSARQAFDAEIFSSSPRLMLKQCAAPKQNLSYLNSFQKRALDVFFSAAILLFLAPVMIVIALAVKFSSPGPVLFRQVRGGYLGKPFCILKFRSMVVSDSELNCNEQACRQDPRITSLGRFLRRHSLDELPQLINVIRGEMSIVGPRPHTVDHDKYYSSQIAIYSQRCKTKPGLTGLAQVSRARGQTVFLDQMEKRVIFDVYYTHTASLFGDICLILATVKEVFVGETAF